ncbi:hypothetical protein EVA_14585 [gut metagenome]|uniref:Uncharacterized protein n=1 Tax=gut metagenome TaxID=749906 RepID=J9G688_9ZZZZ
MPIFYAKNHHLKLHISQPGKKYISEGWTIRLKLRLLL